MSHAPSRPPRGLLTLVAACLALASAACGSSGGGRSGGPTPGAPDADLPGPGGAGGRGGAGGGRPPSAADAARGGGAGGAPADAPRADAAAGADAPLGGGRDDAGPAADASLGRGTDAGGGRDGARGPDAGGPPRSDAGGVTGAWKPRHSYGALLEPKDAVYHGVGQTYLGYLPEMAASTKRKPALYTVYARLDTAASTWDRFKRLMPEAGGHALLVVSMMISTNYVQIADGALDQTLAAFADRVAELGPCFVRIGYEVNGEWNDFYKNPPKFVAAWKKIATALRQRSKEIATVWNIDRPTGGLAKYAAFYPGDEWVDWWSMDVWNRDEFHASRIGPFLADAHARRKPVMIPESSFKALPNAPVLDIAKVPAQRAWDDWFEPYFRMIRDNAGIKGFVYINWHWETLDDGIWAGWGNAHIQDNPGVVERYAAEVQAPLYLHGTSLEDLRATWAR